jgi:hypothetical protein
MLRRRSGAAAGAGAMRAALAKRLERHAKRFAQPWLITFRFNMRNSL